ncbi:trpp-8 [Pristionchus pacificus]|uniref:Trpp-8 n=1 Tax=Pristionchus pacificus TaxID=54126 RepID=A0A2A6BKZ6_PRIPA|nr:trpp-8 [Pristionchus pacificus]|eukprot:PDM66594.1 trpp-8 [Pristionchus pacificus]
MEGRGEAEAGMKEERLALELSSWSPDGRTAIDAAERLVAPRAGRADSDTEAYLAHYGRVRARHAGTPADAAGARSCPLPAVDVGATRVICGERPLPAEVLAGRRGEDGKWRDMERAAFHAIAGTSTGFRPAHIVSDADTDNARVRETPGGERFRVQLRVRNPLPIPLQLRDVHLGVADVERRGEGASSHHHPRSRRQSQEGGGGHPEQLEEEHEGVRVHRIDSLRLQPDEARVIELWVEPAAASAAGGAAAAAAAVAAFRVASMRYQLCCAPGVMARGEIALEIRGKRLNKTEKQMKSPTYATDERLRASVAARAWPLCDVRATRTPAPGGAVYCDQLITLNLEITNAGAEPVEGLALAVDAVDRVMVEEEEGGEDGGSSGTLSLPVSALDLAATPGVRAFALRRGATGARLDPGARRRVVVKLRAPSTPAASHAVSLLLLYRGPGGGATREWRTRVECRVAALLAASTRVLDPYHGLVALRLANALTADDAAMARAEVTRVRVAVAARHRGAVLLAPEDGLAAVRSAAPAAQEDGGERRVRLESGQSQEVCVRIAAPGADGGGGGADASGADADWTLVHGEMPPDWPLPVPEEDAERVEWGRRRLVIGVAWRANIVAKDGMVSSILGESFLPDPFAAAGLHVAGLQLGFSLSTPGGVASPIPAGDDEDGEGGEAAPVYVSVVPPAPVEHDFERSRLCEFPVTLVLRNECGRARMADVELRMKPKVREPLSPPSPPPRQQWWLTRECTRVRVPPRDTVEMRVMVRVLQPSAYDLLGAQMAATVRMEGEERTRALRVPPAMAVVYAAYGGEHA